jgi:phosphoglycolate phosphatase-like HAD superfamily hydrolase
METYGRSVREIAAAAGVTERTARRWKARGRIPEPYATAAGLRLHADLGAASPAWRGWRLCKDEIQSPEGLRFKPAELRALPLQIAALAAYQSERRRNVARIAAAAAITDNAEDVLEHFDMLERVIAAARSVLEAARARQSPDRPADRPNPAPVRSGLSRAL